MADEENPLGGGPFGVGPFGPLVGVAAAVATAINAMAVVTISTPVTRTLFYQAKIAPPPQPPVEAAEEATAESFSVTTGRASSKSLFYQARIGPPPVAAAVDNTGTFATWYVQLSRPLPPLPAKTALYTPFVPQIAPQPTASQWLPRWQGPPSYHPAPAGGSPFVPKEAVLENTVTPDKWLQRFSKAVPVPPPRPTQPFYGYPYEAAVVDNTVTIDKWLQPLGMVSPRYLQPIVGRFTYPPAGPTVATLTTTLDWLRPWQGPPRYLLELPGGSPFVPKEAVLENTVTPDKWLGRFAKAVPTPKPVPTQPFFSYPYEAASNLTTSIEWLRQWPVPPRYQPAKIAAQPFVPREAVLENTITPDKWLFRWQGAVPGRKPIHTQPFYGYPYVAASNLTTTLEWLPSWRGPPSYRPIKVQAPSFVPKAAIVDVVTPDKWHRDLGRAAPRPQARPTQPPFVYSPPAVVTLTTTLEWQQPLSVAVKARPVRHTQPSLYLPEVVVVAEVAEAESFSVTWTHPRRKALFYQAKIAPIYAPIVPPTLTPGPLEWLKPLGIAAKRPAVWPTQPFFAYPYVTEVEGGPADEPERVICILPHSRVAVVPETLRTATVLVDLRVATVPELSRTVEVLFSDRDEESNLSTTLPCSGPVDIPEAEEGAFQDDAFQGDGFQ